MRVEDPVFYAWILTHPLWTSEGCLIHASTEAERCHLKSRGAGGSDYWLLPLCHTCHMESHAEVAFWYRNKRTIARWFGCSLPRIHADYRHLIEAGDMPRPAHMEDLIP